MYLNPNPESAVNIWFSYMALCSWKSKLNITLFASAALAKSLKYVTCLRVEIKVVVLPGSLTLQIPKCTMICRESRAPISFLKMVNINTYSTKIKRVVVAIAVLALSISFVILTVSTVFGICLFIFIALSIGGCSNSGFS